MPWWTPLVLPIVAIVFVVAYYTVVCRREARTERDALNEHVQVVSQRNERYAREQLGYGLRADHPWRRS